MRSILKLISKYGSSNSIIPILVIVSIIATILVYSFIKNKKMKYYINLAIFIVGVILFINGYIFLLNTTGLAMLKIGSEVITFGIVGIMFAFILDILDSLGGIFKKKTVKRK
ncbi:hypothetical protein ABGF49_03630 [Helcococcus ovis]|uniref:Uncharacterized protein n=1 Tax=Helcococcus ovis TaxID=72026 RepID=A0A4R9C293_9FIRM|nr:hypothetical protein [Helcococcus ovis]TFF65474.1 hypothetical protein EQF91_05670 [Helcococcus ovis]TFF65712.1 hypothetical protein EQF92_01465 [Helcococcus ovis]TFF68478.1 hypothetical protein EQF93_01880 [Helcococcus ovis]WNZ01463.1 hypothetical protein EQF90_001040 [Helcococcus ovis]